VNENVQTVRLSISPGTTFSNCEVVNVNRNCGTGGPSARRSIP
jgi:hypothetical protein